MFEEHTPEIDEVEVPDEELFDSPTTGGETTDQVVMSWFQDEEVKPISPDVIVPDEQFDTPDAPTVEDVEVSDVLPEDWNQWTSPTVPSDESWGDEGYSTDWGQVESTLPQDGELWTQMPPEVALTDVVGPGHLADQYWDYQGQTNYCVLYSAASILGEVFGHPVDMEEMVARAEENGWLVRDENGEVLGVSGEDFDDLLASYGVPSHNLTGEQGAWDSLNSALVNDQRVIVSVDSGEIDLGGNDDTENDADHAVAVTGIDYSRGVVIVNDSARSAGLEIPLQVFYDAWRDSNFEITVTDTSLPPVEDAVPPAGTSGFDPDAPNFAMLPFTLHLPSPAPTLPDPEFS
jgi:peptidase C39-like protein